MTDPYSTDGFIALLMMFGFRERRHTNHQGREVNELSLRCVIHAKVGETEAISQHCEIYVYDNGACGIFSVYMNGVTISAQKRMVETIACLKDQTVPIDLPRGKDQ